METTPQTAYQPTPAPHPSRDLPIAIRQWTRDLSHLRTRAARLKRQPEALVSAPVDAALGEAVEMCTRLLQDLAGAEMEIQRRLAESQTERQQADYLLDRLPTACLCADEEGRITRANRAAALWLNVSARHLVGQPLLHFTVDRDGFMDLVGRMRRERAQLQCDLTIRPRERATMHVGVTLMPRAPVSTTEWLWFLAPARAGSTSS
jgi:PAS domain-containing protein